jgi:hypothetical protein
MDLAGDRKLDYFFNQWVHGTDIPTLTSALEVSDLGGGKYKVAGTITQAGVPADFRTRVPVYLDLGNDRLERLGTIPVIGSSSVKLNVDINIPIKPRRALVNSFHDVLAR